MTLNRNSQEPMGLIEKRKQAIHNYVLIRKIRAKQERDYFASEGESDPKRLEAQRERDKVFLQDLKKVGYWVLAFLIFYAFLKTILGLW